MEGYDSLSGIMGTYPGLGIFRQFSILSHRNLLYLQAQLVEKEGKLLNAIADDRASRDNERKRYAFDFEAVMNAPIPPDGEKGQRELMQETCSLLGSYYQALQQQQWLTTLRPVHKTDLNCLRVALKKGSSHESFLHGREWFTWEEDNEYDLISVADENQNKDTLTRWFGWLITQVYHKRFGHQIHKPFQVAEDWRPLHPNVLTHYPDAYTAGVVSMLTTIMAPVLPTVSAMSLYFVEDQLIRLGMIILLSLLFSIAVALVGVPRRIDSFAATAAFTAVLMVFVGNNTECTC